MFGLRSQEIPEMGAQVQAASASKGKDIIGPGAFQELNAYELTRPGASEHSPGDDETGPR